MEIEIFETEFGEGDIALAAEFPVEPYGQALFASLDATENSRKILQELADAWRELWPKMRQRLEQGIVGYKIELDLSSRPFIASVCPMEKGVFMSDEADIFVRFDFDDVPVWDFFIRGSHLAHFQPVF